MKSLGTYCKLVITYLIIATLFITDKGLETRWFFVHWYHFIHILFACYALFRYHKINKKILAIYVLIAIYSLVTYNYGLNLVIKQLVNIGFSLVVFYNFIVFEEFDLLQIFKRYITFSKAVLVLGFIQVFLFMVNQGHLFIALFPFLSESNMTVRFQSIAYEPSFIAYVLAPIVFLSFYNLTHRISILINKVWSALFAASYLLTLSTVAYTGILLMLTLLYFKNLTLDKLYGALFVFFLLLIISVTSYVVVPEIKLRVDDTLYGLSHPITEDENYRIINLSSYALLSNTYVTMQSLNDQLWTGNGLGTHQLTYDKYLPKRMKAYSSLNREDANSLALRLLTETGLIGLLVFSFFLFRYKTKMKFALDEHEKILWILNIGIFVMMVMVLIRNGDYTAHGRILFLLLYYYSYTFYKNATFHRSSYYSFQGPDIQNEMK